jgi:myo-inositol-1(or 4)-monophosphatase
MSDVLAFSEDLAARTGALLKRYFERPRVATRYKPDHTLITEADLAANDFILSEIRAAFPDDHILSEEADTCFPEDSRPTWIIDPLDGTTNFDKGLHYWGVSIARVRDGEPEAAGLCFPLLGEVYSAYSGRGARLNGEPLQVPPAESHMVSFFLCDSRVNRRYTSEIRYKPRILGSAAYNFCGVASGLGVVGFESIPRIWDIAGSWLVLKEAGGALQPLDGPLFPLEPGADYNSRGIPLIGAADTAMLQEAAAAITLIR